MSWNGVVGSIGAPAGASGVFFKYTDFGFDNPPQGDPGYDANGDSSGPALNLLSETFDGFGKLTSAEIVGINDAQEGSGSPIGQDIYTDLGNPTAAAFIQNEINLPLPTPEPATAPLILLATLPLLTRRQKRGQESLK